MAPNPVMERPSPPATAPVPQPSPKKINSAWVLLSVGGLAFALLVAYGLRKQWQPPRPRAEGSAPVPVTRQAEALGVTALGRLVPAGNVRRLAAPSGSMGSMPRVAALEVEEGDRVQAGQLLASFDSRVDALADLAVAEATITSLGQRRRILEIDLARYRRLQIAGAVTTEGVEQRQLRLLEVQQELIKARAERQRQAVKLPFTELRAPFAGTVLQIHARTGERPAEKGVLELGRSDQMEAVVEVYESDINRVRLGQSVTMRSENGGFNGSLRGRVIRIEPSVRQRQVLSTDPSADTDARIVEVRVKLLPTDAARVKNLSGLKLIAKLRP